jgi:hypothetical protein
VLEVVVDEGGVAGRGRAGGQPIGERREVGAVVGAGGVVALRPTGDLAGGVALGRRITPGTRSIT